MNVQTTLTKYYKSKTMSNKSNNKGNGTTIKRRSLSLKKASTPSKPHETPSKAAVPVKEDNNIIVLSSDSEQEETPSKKRNVGLTVKSIESLMGPKAPVEAESPNSSAEASNSSSTTFVYNLSPGTVIWQPHRTPSKSLSPGSSKDFYSPTRKRIIKNKSPVKRNLVNQFNQNISPKQIQNNTSFAEIVDEKDDKTVFLLSIIDKCLKTDSLKHLLENDSQILLEKCMQVPKPGMKLMCRLYWRQHIWYRIEDIGEIANGERKEGISYKDLATCLAEYGLITLAQTEEGATKLNFDDYVKLLKRHDLVQICKELKLKVQSKQDAVEALRSFCKSTPISNFYTQRKVENNFTRVLKILKAKTGPCYKISELAQETLYNLYVLMYLGIDYSIIRDKKLELILLYDKIKRDTYPIDKEMVVDDASVVFQDRAEFYRYLQAHKLYENYLEKTDPTEKCETVRQAYNFYKEIDEDHMLRYKSLPTWLRIYTPANIYIKMLEKGVQELKKLKSEDNYKLAVEILDTLIGQIGFRQHKKALWYAEKALILHSYLDSSEKAAEVLLEGFKDDLSEDAKDALRPRANKIANQQNIDLKEELREELRSFATKETILESNLPGDHIYKQPKDNYNQRGKLEFEVHTNEGKATVSAEKYCLLHYVNTGQYTDGEHWEGRIVSGLFFLLFWDIIYSKPRGVCGIFMNHYQRYPLDMFSESFYLNRKTLIDERLQFIQQCTEEQLLDFMQSKWEERPTSEVSEVPRGPAWEQARALTSRAGGAALAALCRRLAAHYGYWRSGFPDLTLWNTRTNKIKFVEVKTDADKPSVKQLQWLRYLLEHGVDAGFCYVGVNTTRSRARPSAMSMSSD